MAVDLDFGHSESEREAQKSSKRSTLAHCLYSCIHPSAILKIKAYSVRPTTLSRFWGVIQPFSHRRQSHVAAVQLRGFAGNLARLALRPPTVLLHVIVEILDAGLLIEYCTTQELSGVLHADFDRRLS